MRYDENEQLIKEALDTIVTPDYDMRREVLQKAIQHTPGRFSKKKLGIILIAATLVVSTTVIAKNISYFERLFSIVAPEMGELLQTIEEEQTQEIDYTRIAKAKNKDQGIIAEPLAVVNDEEMMVIYFTMQDLEGDRLDESILIDSYWVDGVTINNIQVIGYDATNKTAILKLTANGGNSLNHKAIEIRIQSILGRKKIKQSVPVDIDLNESIMMPTSSTRFLSRKEVQGGGGTGDMWGELEENGRIEILRPNSLEMSIPGVTSMLITNVGMIDGKLHVQTKWENEKGDNHGYFFLTDQEDNKIECKENNFYFDVDEENNVQFGSNYVEYILDIGEQTLPIELKLYIVEYENIIEGDWRITLDLDALKETIKIPSTIQKEGMVIEMIEVSPLGLTLRGKGDTQALEKEDIGILLENDVVVKPDSRHSSQQMGDFVVKFGVETPIDMAEVKAVQIEDEIIEVTVDK